MGKVLSPAVRDLTSGDNGAFRPCLRWKARAQGVFAGVSLEGSTLRSDDGANKNLYGKELSAKEIVREGKVKTTTAVQPLIALLQKISPRHANA